MKHELYSTWSMMKQRCSNKKTRGYKNYGGRGIVVCDRWRNSFISFLEDMGPKPTRKHTIDRINNDGNYEPGNCRWATMLQQAQSRRVGIRRSGSGKKATLVLFKGKRIPICKASKMLGISTNRIKAAVKLGIPLGRIPRPPNGGRINFSIKVNSRILKKLRKLAMKRKLKRMIPPSKTYQDVILAGILNWRRNNP